jgi:acetyl-CoA carboxylase biotin carboxyl carrier protein
MGSQEQREKKISFTIADIRALAKIVRHNELSELEVKLGEHRLRIRREITTGVASVPVMQAQAIQAPLQAQAEAASPLDSTSEDDGSVLITSPFVGTFYRAPSPESPPFVERDQTVKMGQVLCIVEAMKLMNEIEAESDCKIAEILVKNAESVEFGQPLFRVFPLA